MIQKLLNKPLLLSPQGFESINAIEWLPAETITPLGYELKNGIAIIPIHGLLTKRTEFFSALMSTTSYEDIFDAISSAIEDEKVERILLDIDSPGGEVSGLFDLVDFIFNSRNQKPIYSVANDYACSAAYAIASATEKIFVTRTSCVGSIGVIATHLDVSEADKKDGIKFTTVYAGDKKNDLSPHEPLSENAIKDLQAEVDRLYDIFVATVSRNRYLSESKIRKTQAATYFGQNAVIAGLADELSSNALKEISAQPLVISKVKIKGENMTEDIEAQISNTEKTECSEVESQIDAVEKYKAEVLEITKLCKLAHAENKISEFIEHGLSAEQVKEKLLASVSNMQHEIVSAIYQKDERKENPVVAAAKARQRDVASKN